ncbi:haloacid dehalogenase-like protein [Scenedesmus sp. PABB004]|nr:haloacid dehalogenase-like protein [Scenedesmus sp. PABB004]
MQDALGRAARRQWAAAPRRAGRRAAANSGTAGATPTRRRRLLYDGVVFDMDGTLTEAHIDFADMRRRTDIPVGDLFVAMESWEEPGRIKASMDIILEIEAEAAARVSAKPGLIDLLEMLRDADVKVALVTRNTTASVAALFALIGEEWRTLFSEVRTREFRYVKPDKRLLLDVAQAWQLHPGKLLMVGDSFEDVEVGNAAGAATCLVKGGGNEVGGAAAAPPPGAVPTLSVGGLDELRRFLIDSAPTGGAADGALDPSSLGLLGWSLRSESESESESDDDGGAAGLPPWLDPTTPGAPPPGLDFLDALVGAGHVTLASTSYPRMGAAAGGLQACPQGGGDAVLHVGCGDGALSKMLASKGLAVLAVDADASGAARRGLRCVTYSGEPLRAGSLAAAAAAAPAGGVDAVLVYTRAGADGGLAAGEVLSAEALDELRTVLRPGGRLCVEAPGADADGARAALERGGWTRRRAHPLHPRTLGPRRCSRALLLLASSRQPARPASAPRSTGCAARGRTRSLSCAMGRGQEGGRAAERRRAQEQVAEEAKRKVIKAWGKILPFGAQVVASAAAYTVGVTATQLVGFVLKISCATPVLGPCMGVIGVGVASALAGQASKHTHKLAMGGRFSSLMPSDLARPGALAFESIPARPEASEAYAKPSVKRELARIFRRDGCHHCGSRRGPVIGDHMPPNKLVGGRNKADKLGGLLGDLPGVGKVRELIGLAGRGRPLQRFYPQCQRCSIKQATALRTGRRVLVLHLHAPRHRSEHLAGVFVGIRQNVPPVSFPPAPPGRGAGRLNPLSLTGIAEGDERGAAAAERERGGRRGSSLASSTRGSSAGGSAPPLAGPQLLVAELAPGGWELGYVPGPHVASHAPHGGGRAHGAKQQLPPAPVRQLGDVAGQADAAPRSPAGAREAAAPRSPVASEHAKQRALAEAAWQDLKDKFRECGTVVYANVTRGDDGRSKGWGIVEFETPDEAIAAVNTLNGADLGGRRIAVREDREDRDVKQFVEGEEGGAGRGRGPRGGRVGGERGRGRGRAPRPPIEGEPSGFQVCVQGIPWKYAWKELKDLLAECGEVERADVMTAPDGRSKGWGTVRFTTKEAANAAIEQFHGSELEGRTLTVFLDKKA